jgi:hypothetical protein
MSRLLVVALTLGACGGCGPGGGSPDVFVPVDIDNGSCGNLLHFTGEYVDWDNDTHFCGVMGAVFAEGGAMDTTAPNGRFDFCITGASPGSKVTIAPPTGNSQCTVPPSNYTLPAIMWADRLVILSGGFYSGRAFTTMRQTTIFQDVGQAFDPAKAQVFVHVNGTPRAISLAAAHGPPQAIAQKAWAAGDTGHDVFFPNVDPAGGMTSISASGTVVGTSPFPIAAGTITNVAILLR